MDNNTTQAIFTVSMPTLAVLVGILVNNSRLGDLRSYMDGKFSTVDGKFADIRTYIDGKFEEVNRRLETIERRLDRVADGLGKHESRITGLEERTNPLRQR